MPKADHKWKLSMLVGHTISPMGDAQALFLRSEANLTLERGALMINLPIF